MQSVDQGQTDTGADLELVCPAGALPSLKAAVDNGADAVYIGFRDDTNARHFPGLNFDESNISAGIRYAHQRGCRVFVAINSYPQPTGWPRWERAVSAASELGADALILADIALLEYALEKYPDTARHLSVQASATNEDALRFYVERFGIRRAVLPRVLSLTQIKRLAAHDVLPLEVFGFGSLCIMAEGRCHLSSYMTGESPNMNGVCSPAWAVRWQERDEHLDVRLNGTLIDRFTADESPAYPTLCKGRFEVGGQIYHALEEPTSLNTLAVLPQLLAAGVRAIKIEGRQRGPAYVAKVTQVWRQAIDRAKVQRGAVDTVPRLGTALDELAEGAQTTLGAYHRPWQ